MLLWLLLGTPAARACDPAALEAAKLALSAAPSADLQRRTLVGSLVKACTFNGRIADMMRLMPSAAAEELPRLEQRAAVDEAQAWLTACPGGKPALDSSLGKTGSARRDALYGPCDLVRFKYATEADLAAADGLVLLSILVAKHFEEQRVEDRTALPVLRALAGIGQAAAAPTGSDVWAQARAAVDGVARLAWNGLSDAEWGTRATTLVTQCDALRVRPPAERQANRQTEYDTCLQAGRAIENANDPTLLHDVGGSPVNWGIYTAAAVAMGDPLLIEHTPDETLRNSARWMLDQLKSGAIPLPR